jgi:hypothetical protein
VAVSAPVLKEPVAPAPSPLEEVHEVLLTDDHEIVVLAPFEMEVDAAEMFTVGMVLTIVVELSPAPPHEARVDIVNSTAKKTFSSAVEPTVLMIDIFASLRVASLNCYSDRCKLDGRHLTGSKYLLNMELIKGKEEMRMVCFDRRTVENLG